MFLIREGFPPEWITDLDMTSFDELFVSNLRINYREKIEDAWCNMIVSHQDKKALNKYLKPLVKFANQTDPKKGSDGKSFQNFIKGLRYRKTGRSATRGPTRRDLRPGPD